MNTVKFLVIILGFLVQPGLIAATLNQMLEYYKPNDIFVVLNSTTTGGEAAIGAMTYPRYVSIRGDFSNFIRRSPILSVFPDNFVLVLFTDDTCRSVIPILRHQLSQGIIVKRTKIVIVADTVERQTIEDMFHGLWTMGLLNVFVLDNAFIFSFNPFTNEFLIQLPALDYHRVVSLDRAANFQGTTLYVPLIDVYPGAQNITWHNRSILVGEFVYVQRPLAEYFNATLCVYKPKTINYGFEFFRNATSSVVHPGVGEELVAGRGDLTLMPRVYATSNYFDSLSPLHFRECNLLIPKSGKIPQYTILVSIASSWVGLSSIITLIAIVAFTAAMKRILHIKLEMTRFVLELSSVFVGQSFSFPIKTLSMRITIIFWLLTCIALVTLFNAQIVTCFLTPMFVPDLDFPFEAIEGEGFNIYTFDDFVYYLRGNSKELFPTEKAFQKLLTKLRGVPREEFFNRVMHPNGRDMFMVIAMANNLVEKTKYLTEQTYSYHKTQPIFISLTANIVPRGSIIYNHYNDFNYRIFEAGLLQHWKSLELLFELKFGSGNEAQETFLTVEDLYSAFLVLILGYALATAVFAAEKFGIHCWTKFFNARHLSVINRVN